ncbi:MAG: S1C family serine protease [Akkermansiaceae bacterium]
MTTHSGKHHPAKVLGVYPEHDLAVLKINANLQPIDLTTAAPVEQGSFLVLARHDGGVEGRGVVSVKTRSLKLSDRGFLGVMLDFSAASKQGVPLREVVKQSAAERAGLQGGDIITTIEGTPIQGAMEMRSTLQKLRPGDKIKVGYRRGKEEHTTTVSLGTRPKTSAPAMQGRRKAAMERMGAIPSRVRDNFPSVIQSDMAVEKEDAGAPVTDLDGNVVGIVIARASRIKTYIIPASTLLEITASDPKNIASLPPSPLDKNGKIARNTTRPSRAIPQNEDLPEDIEKVRRLLGEVERSGNDNEENLRKIREALRLLQGDDR